MIAPIEDVEYTNFFQYFTTRLKTTFGEETFKILTENEHFVAGMDVIVAMNSQGQLKDKDLLAVVHAVSLEILKDAVFVNYSNNRANRVLDPAKVLEYFLYFKRDSIETNEESEMIVAAERLVAGFYTDIFSEH